MARNRAIAAVIVAGAALAASAAVAVNSAGPAGEMQQALQCLRAGDFARAESLATSLSERPQQPLGRAWVIVAAARQNLQQYASAARAYRLYLASCQSDTNRDFVLQQIQACQSAQSPAAPRPSPSQKLTADDRKQLAEAAEQTFTESSEHFVVKARNARLARITADEAENALKRICHSILGGQEYPQSVEVHVWADRREYLAQTLEAQQWSGGSFSLQNADGVMTRRIDLAQRDDKGDFAVSMLDRVLPHELCHLVLKEQFGDVACPLFLNEGLAMLAEAQIDPDRIALAGATLAGKDKIALEDMFVRQKYGHNDAPAFYAEALSFTLFLHSRLDREQFRAFLDNIKSGCTVVDSLQRALYIPHNDDFVRRLAETWEQNAIADVQFVRALQEQQ